MHTIHVEDFLKQAAVRGASDIYVVAGKPITYKLQGDMVPIDDTVLTPEMTSEVVKRLYALGGRSLDHFSTGDDDFAAYLPEIGRFRVNAYRQRFTCASVIRTIPLGVPDPTKINIPETIVNLAELRRGIILFTGTTGSGKSTSLACLIDRINSTRDDHIITIEDPIEFRHTHKKSIISQRELETDTQSYLLALRAAMRQVPDVILLGEMRDHETISSAITAAETGHLVFSTLHTMGASPTIDRIIDVFPPNQQEQIRTQLALTLQAVVSQQLVPTKDGKRHPAFEILIATAAVRNLIRENKVYQIDNIIQTSSTLGMKSMDHSLLDLYKRNLISRDDAISYSVNPKEMRTKI